MNGAICRTQLLSRYEEVLTGRTERSTFFVHHEPFRTVCRSLMNLQPNYRRIAILPNDGNKVIILPSDNYELKDLDNGKKKNSFHPLPSTEIDKQVEYLDPPVKCLCSCMACSEMDRRTVKLAMAVLEQKIVRTETQKRKQDTENRLRNIERKMEQMLDFLKELKRDAN